MTIPIVSLLLWDPDLRCYYTDPAPLTKGRNPMLNSDERRPAFDRWFNSLDAAEQTVVVDAAMRQRDTLQGEDPRPEDTPVSLIDCLENIWDHASEVGLVEATR